MGVFHPYARVMLPRLLLRLLFALSLGVVVGGAFGQIVTGDSLYIPVWAIALGVAVLTGIVVTTGLARSLTRTEGEAPPAVPRWQWVVAGLLAVIGLGSAMTPAVLGLTSGRLDNPITGSHQAL